MAVLVSKYLLNNLSGEKVRLRASKRRQGRRLAKSHTLVHEAVLDLPLTGVKDLESSTDLVSLWTLERENIPVKQVEL